MGPAAPRHGGTVADPTDAEAAGARTRDDRVHDLNLETGCRIAMGCARLAPDGAMARARRTASVKATRACRRAGGWAGRAVAA